MLSQVAQHQQFFPIFGTIAAVGQQIRIVRVKELDLALADDLVGLTQMHQHLVKAAHRIRVIHLGGGVDLTVVVCHTNPRRSGGKTCIFAAIPLHRGAGIIPAALCNDVQRFFLGLVLPPQNFIVVEAFHIAVLVNGCEVRVRHAQFFALINVGGAAHKMDRCRQHFGALLPIFSVTSKAAHRTGLVMVAPEQGIPAVVLLHSFLPGLEQLLQRHMVRRHQFPLLPILVIHLQVVEIKAHTQLVAVCTCVADAVFQRGGGHLAYGHHAVNAACLYQLLQILMHVAAIGIEPPSVALKIILINFRFGDHVDYIETEALDALCLPKAQNICHFFPHGGVFPVDICLHHIVQVQIPLAQPGHILPCRTAEF